MFTIVEKKTLHVYPIEAKDVFEALEIAQKVMPPGSYWVVNPSFHVVGEFIK